jgi:transposase
MNRKPYPSDVTDEEWAFVVPYLTLMTEDAPQRECDLRVVFNGVRWIVRTGAQWRMMPNDLPLTTVKGLPPWWAMYQQSQPPVPVGWQRAEVFEAINHDLRMLLRLVAEREAEPSAVILDSRTV